MMVWKKVLLEKCALLERALQGLACQNKPMFGCPAYFANGNWFCGVHEDNILVKLAEADRETLLAAHRGAKPFEPMKGRPMREVVVLPEAVTKDPAEFRGWLESAHGYALTLPAKKKKVRRKPRVKT